MGILPRCKDRTFAGSLSTQTTSFPFSARHAPATRPTYPLPMTAIFILLLTWGGRPPGPPTPPPPGRPPTAPLTCLALRSRARSLGLPPPDPPGHAGSPSLGGGGTRLPSREH